MKMLLFRLLPSTLLHETRITCKCKDYQRIYIHAHYGIDFGVDPGRYCANLLHNKNIQSDFNKSSETWWHGIFWTWHNRGLWEFKKEQRRVFRHQWRYAGALCLGHRWMDDEPHVQVLKKWWFGGYHPAHFQIALFGVFPTLEVKHHPCFIIKQKTLISASL